MTNYFENCRTAEDVKQAYKMHARNLHPDCNPDKDTTEEFQEMSRQYEQAWQRCKNIHVNAEGETYEKENTTSASEYADLINSLLHMSGLIIELCGSWLWVTGNTYPVRKQLRELHFQYSSKKQAWYFHREPYWKFSKSERSMEDIRSMYGSEKYATKTDEAKKIIAG